MHMHYTRDARALRHIGELKQLRGPRLVKQNDSLPVQRAYRSQNLRKLKMLRQRSIPNENLEAVVRVL